MDHERVESDSEKCVSSHFLERPKGKAPRVYIMREFSSERGDMCNLAYIAAAVLNYYFFAAQTSAGQASPKLKIVAAM